MRVGLLAFALACTKPAPVKPVAKPSEGIAIAVYSNGETGFGVVDDRRRVTLANGSLVLDRIDAEAAMPSLVIEPLDATLAIGACVRERVDSPESLHELAHRKPTFESEGARPVGELLSPLVRCAATGANGSHLVRVLYVAPSFGYRGQHVITLAHTDSATIATRFVMTTPAWNLDAQITLFEGLPGRDEPPKQIASGTVKLDGTAAKLELPARSTRASLVTIFDGAVPDETTAITDPSWNRESRRLVWTWVELADTTLAAGVLRVKAELPGDEPRELIIASSDRERLGTALRIPLWTEETLVGLRKHFLDQFTDRSFTQRFELSVTNIGHEPRDVWIEERLRPIRGRTILRTSPGREPAIVHDALRVKVTVPPGRTERTGFTISYPR